MAFSHSVAQTAFELNHSQGSDSQVAGIIGLWLCLKNSLTGIQFPGLTHSQHIGQWFLFTQRCAAWPRSILHISMVLKEAHHGEPYSLSSRPSYLRATANTLSAAVDLIALNIPDKCTHAVCRLCPASFKKHSVPQAHHLLLSVTNSHRPVEYASVLETCHSDFLCASKTTWNRKAGLYFKAHFIDEEMKVLGLVKGANK